MKPAIPLYLQIMAGMALGLVAGPLLGGRAGPLGELGKLVIQLIKAVATPLLFLAIVNAILKTEVKGRAGLRMLGFASINGCIALGIGLFLSNVLQPGLALQSQAVGAGGAEGAAAPAAHAAPAVVAHTDKKLDLIKTFSGYIPSSLVQPFVENVVLSVVLMALLFGFALRAMRHEEGDAGRGEGPPTGLRVLEDGVAALLRIMEIVLGWVIRLIPIAVFGVVAKTVAEQGFAPARGLGIYLAVALLGLVLHVGITYQLWIMLGSHLTLRRFWGEAKDPVVYAMGANSSLATLPLTLRALDRLGVSRASSTLGACVGTNFNNDGIILYEGMAVLFVAQAQGLQLDLGQQLIMAGCCLVAAIGVAGVPEAGIISLALVLNTVGLSVELLPLLLTVDWIVGRGRSVTNVLSDMVLSTLIDRGHQE